MDAGGGEPGGEGGMEKFGMGGMVRLRMAARLVVYGDVGGSLSLSSLMEGRSLGVSVGMAVGPCVGPIGADG